MPVQRDLGDPLTNRQIRELQGRLFSGPVDDRQLFGLVACHDALGWSHRRNKARSYCMKLIEDGR